MRLRGAAVVNLLQVPVLVRLDSCFMLITPISLCLCRGRLRKWIRIHRRADDEERKVYHAGEDALRLPDVIARLRTDLVRRGALKEAGGVSSLDLPKLLIETYLLEGQFPTREAVLSPPLRVT